MPDRDDVPPRTSYSEWAWGGTLASLAATTPVESGQRNTWEYPQDA
jgi:hypothetical protein